MPRTQAEVGERVRSSYLKPGESAKGIAVDMNFLRRRKEDGTPERKLTLLTCPVTGEELDVFERAGLSALLDVIVPGDFLEVSIGAKDGGAAAPATAARAAGWRTAPRPAQAPQDGHDGRFKRCEVTYTHWQTKAEKECPRWASAEDIVAALKAAGLPEKTKLKVTGS